MPRISQEDAARIARAHGLSLTDANALFAMADTTAQAESLAAEFARPAQLNKEDVRQLYREGRHAEIVKAKQEGRLADMLGQKPSSVPPIPRPDAGSLHQITKEQVATMTPDQILAAKDAGQLASLLGQPHYTEESLHGRREQ
jgi:hypothetical protein